MLAFKLIGGAVIGAALGLFVGRAHVCGAGKCQARGKMAASIVSGAFFGAAMAFYLAR